MTSSLSLKTQLRTFKGPELVIEMLAFELRAMCQGNRGDERVLVELCHRGLRALARNAD